MKNYTMPEMMIETYELEDAILSSTSTRLEAKNPYGDGTTSIQIENIEL